MKALAPDAAAVPAQLRPNKKQISRQRSTEIILDCALKLVVQKGFGNMTIEQVADAAGLTKGAVYHYFDSKENLLLALLKQIEHDALEVDDGYCAGTATDRLVRYIHYQGNKAREFPDSFLFLIVLSADFSSLGTKAGAQVDSVFARMGRALEQIIRAGCLSKEFHCEVPEKDIALFFVASFCGNVLQWHRSGRKRRVGMALVRTVRMSVLSLLGVPRATHRQTNNAPKFKTLLKIDREPKTFLSK